MALAPYASDIKSRKIPSDLATRLQQFLQIQKLIEAMSVVGNTPQNTHDLQAFGNEISELYTGYMDNKLSAEQAETADKIFADEKLMDLADKISESTDSAEKLEIVRSYTAQKITDIALQQAGYVKISEGNGVNTGLNLAGTLFVILDRESKKINSEDFARRIIDGNLSAEEIPLAVNALQAAKQRVMTQLRTDWQTYKDSHTANANIEEQRQVFEDLLSDKKEFHYKTYPELHNVLLCIRDDFDAKDIGSKPMFLKMIGNMLDCGQNQVNNKSTSAARKTTAYNNFIKLIKQQYPDNSDEVINTLLDVGAKTDAKEVEKLRREAFEKKSKELYCKFVSAVLVKYAENNKEINYQNYVDTSIAGYIDDLKKGRNNIAQNLHLADEKNSNSLKDLIDDTAEHQIISVHHKVPVAAAVPLYVETHPELHKDTQKVREFINEVRKRCPSAAENRTDNDLLIIGFGLTVFPEESKKDKSDEICKIADDKKRAKAIQTLKHKNIIYNLYQEYFPVDNTRAIREEILRIVNDPSNHMLPIGNDVHQNSEPNGNMAMIKQNEQIVSVVENVSKVTGIKTTEKVNDMAVLAAQYDKSKFKQILPKLNSTLSKALEEYNKFETPIISQRVLLKLPETPFISKIRNMLSSKHLGLTMDSMRKTIGLSK